jgi:diaminohydroxyphosphoribosylaminopyrimidine deaminase/5-amino-6-(5-phosphoribosylamino)uracil reductase
MQNNLPAGQKKIDEHFMRIALDLAGNGTQTTSPNPRVGCVIVRNGQIIGKGWHHLYGGPHAEVEAVRDAGDDVAGATVYVSLEPCCHYGKTPPCAQMLVEHRIKRVVAGMSDPNPKVNGKGFEILRNAGITITSGVLENEAKYMNRGFIHSIVRHRPWVTLKSAISLDGDVALSDGSSKWVTGSQARAKVQMMRAENDALLTGVGTILADDPEFNVRTSACAKTPLRVILDGTLKTPVDAKIFDTGPLLFFAKPDADKGKIALFKDKGASIEILDANPAEEIGQILNILCQKGINYLMVEAGPRVTSSFLASRFTDEVSLFMAPKLLGSGMHCTDYLHISDMNDALTFKNIDCVKCGKDIWIKGVLSCSPDL